MCVSANYRLRPAAGFPEHLIDAKKVIAWVRKHADTSVTRFEAVVDAIEAFAASVMAPIKRTRW